MLSFARATVFINRAGRPPVKAVSVTTSIIQTLPSAFVFEYFLGLYLSTSDVATEIGGCYFCNSTIKWSLIKQQFLNVIDYKKVNDGLFATMAFFKEIVPLTEMETWTKHLDGNLQNYTTKWWAKLSVDLSHQWALVLFHCFYGFWCVILMQNKSPFT